MRNRVVRAQLHADLLNHRKFQAAGELIGKNGPAVALGFYSLALLVTNKYLTDGFLSRADIKGLAAHVDNPVSIADALEKAGLFERENGGWRIHDFEQWNPKAAVVKKRLKKDRERKEEK